MITIQTHRSTTFVRAPLSEMSEFASLRYVTRENQQRVRDRAHQWHRLSDVQWFGYTQSETERHVTQGWPEGVARIREMIDDLNAEIPEPVSIRRKQRWGDDGEEIDVQRVYSGQLETAWRGPQRVNIRAPRVISLCSFIGGAVDYSPEALFWVGATAAALTDRFENAGYRVDLTGVTLTAHACGQVLNVVPIKEANDPFSLDVTATALCHSAVWRGYGITMIASAPFRVDGGFGSVIESEYSLRRELEKGAEIGVVAAAPDAVVPATYDRASAIRAAQQVIQKINSLTEEQS